ncbi:MAG: hypothetical protein MR550_01910 [Bacilli bacterium]|nr:hypothetical protein [Bacilli bacterium]
MKTKYKNIIIIICSLFFLVNLIIYRNLVFDTVGFSLNIWITSLLPALFPFFIVSDILINYDVIKYFPKVIRNSIKYLFNVSDNGLVIILLSMLSGFPSNARNIKNMYLDKKITKEEGEHLLYFTHFSNPMFILGTIPLILNSNKISKYILISHYLANIILGICLRKYNRVNDSNNSNYKEDKHNFGLVLTTSIRKSLDSVLSILGTLTVFLIMSTLLINFFNLDNTSSLLIKSILELTSGLKELGSYNLLDKYLLIISSCILSFGGLSVHMQVINELVDTDISYKNYFIGRILQVVLSLGISYLISLFAF